MPPFVRVDAVVLRAADYRDYDRMLTLMTPDQGLVSAAAYGARRVKSPLLNAAALFSSGEYVLRQTKGHLNVQSVSLGQMHYELHSDPVRFAYACFACEICLNAVQPGQAAPEAFYLMRAALAHLNYGEGDARDVIGPFIVRLMREMGVGMQLRRCAKCEGRLVDARFDALAGGAVCINCAKGQGLPVLTHEMMMALRQCTVGEFAPVAMGEAFALCADYAAHRFERAFPSLKVALALQDS